VTVGITAYGRLSLQGLLTGLVGTTCANQWTQGEMSAIRQETYQEVKDIAPLGVYIIETIRRELDDNAVLVSGTTQIGYWSHLAFPALSPAPTSRRATSPPWDTLSPRHWTLRWATSAARWWLPWATA